MSDGDRTAGFDLFLEERDHRTVASEDISKADCHKLGFCIFQIINDPRIGNDFIPSSG